MPLVIAGQVVKAVYGSSCNSPPEDKDKVSGAWAFFFLP